MTVAATNRGWISHYQLAKRQGHGQIDCDGIMEWTDEHATPPVAQCDECGYETGVKPTLARDER